MRSTRRPAWRCGGCRSTAQPWPSAARRRFMRNRARRRAVIAVAILLVIAVAAFGWRAFRPGPLTFAGGSTVPLSDYHAADPTGVPAELAGADLVKRGQHIARLPDCMLCHTPPDGKVY